MKKSVAFRFALSLLVLLAAASLAVGQNNRQPLVTSASSRQKTVIVLPAQDQQVTLQLDVQSDTVRTRRKLDVALKGLLLRLDREQQKTTALLMTTQRLMQLPEAARIEVYPHEQTHEPMVGTLIELAPFASASAAKQRFEAAGFSVGAVVGNRLVVKLPLAQLETLSDDEDIQTVEASRLRHPLLDKSRVDIKADSVNQGLGLPKSFSGEGVICGVVDSGIDWTHSVFKNGTQTRLLNIWDMSIDGRSPSGYNYGSEWSSADINAGIVTEQDAAGGGSHGTHVTGIMAGNGGGTAYIGIAPKSNIVFVKGFRTTNGFYDTDIINACNYIFAKADALNKPAVINLSLGSQDSPHDGTSSYEQMLSGIASYGKVIVAAAGNEGSDQIHIGFTASSNTQQAVFDLASGTTSIDLVLWTSGTLKVSLAAYSPDLTQKYAQSTSVSTGQANGQVLKGYLTTTDGLKLGYLTLQSPSQSKQIEITVDISNQTVSYPVVWSLLLTGSGTANGWITDEGAGNFFSLTGAGSISGDNVSSVASPATAQNVIAAGAYVTKTNWVSIDGYNYQYATSTILDSLCDFSSQGPTVDGRTKPEVTAPGEGIASALAANLTIGGADVNRAFVLSGGKFFIDQGTSMSSPHVAGTIALMMQANDSLASLPNSRRLDYASIVNIFKSTARTSAATANQQQWGAGKLNALEAVRKAGNLQVPAPIPTSYKLAQNKPNPPNPSNPVTTIEYSVSQTAFITIKVYDVLGRLIATLVNETKQAQGDPYRVIFNTSKLASGIYFYQLRAGGFSTTMKMLVLK
jgi:minor extracellular serine protease Vpr